MAVGAKIRNIVFDADDALALARFWSEVTGWPTTEWSSPEEAAVRDTSGTGLYFMRVPEEKVVKNRVHLDLDPGEGRTSGQEIDRLEALGAKVVAEHPSHTVLTDPYGNEFCVTGPRT